MASSSKERVHLVEALIFAASEPVSAEKLSSIIENITPEAVLEVIQELNTDYERGGRAFRIVRGGGGYRFSTSPEFGRWIKKLVIAPGRIRLSKPALETLSIIAYRQPITRADIEAVRGVDVSGVLHLLLDRKLIRVDTRQHLNSRPLRYGTTPAFLKYFGIDRLEDLPSADKFAAAAESSPHDDTETISGLLFEDILANRTQEAESSNED